MPFQLTIPADVETFPKSLRLLRAPRFGTYFAATLLSNIGVRSQQVAEPWLLLSLGASSFVIGLDTFVQSAPAFNPRRMYSGRYEKT